MCGKKNTGLFVFLLVSVAHLGLPRELLGRLGASLVEHEHNVPVVDVQSDQSHYFHSVTFREIVTHHKFDQILQTTVEQLEL